MGRDQRDWPVTGTLEFDVADKKARSEVPGFSETKHLVLSMNSSKFMLDFDSGETMDPPATTGRSEQGKMDVYTTQMQPYHYPTGLIGYSLQGLEVKPSDWNASVDDVRRALAGKIYALKGMDVGPEKNPTYFFKTRDGALGILQLIEVTDEPKGIRLRYKTILRDALKPREVPAGERKPGEESPPTETSAVPKRLNYFTTGHDLHVACSPDGQLIAVANGNPTRILQTSGTSRVQGGWKPTADILDADSGKNIAALKLTTGEEDAVLAATPRITHVEATALAFSPNGDVVAVGTNIGQVKLFNAHTGELIGTLDDEQARTADKDTPESWKPLKRAMGSVASLVCSPDGTLLATCGGSFREFSDVFDGVHRLGRSDSVTGPGRLKLWDVKTGKLKHDLVGHGGQANAVAFSPDGNLLASAGSWVSPGGSGHGTGVIVWNPGSGEKLSTIETKANGGTHTVAFSPNSKMLAIGSHDFDKEHNRRSATTISVNYALSGIAEWQKQFSGWASPKAFSPDGTSVLVVTGKTIRFLDSATGAAKGEIKSENLSGGGRWHDFAVAARRGKIAISAVDGDEGSVEVWDFPDPDAAGTPKAAQ
jgi:WD40 repeat protein